jgi:tRNA(fMet)-specific endonuclease VapC
VELVRYFAAWAILPFDDAAAAQTTVLRKLKLRMGTMDMKIAATALSRDALLLTANSKDFSKVPGLRTENWFESPTSGL